MIIQKDTRTPFKGKLIEKGFIDKLTLKKEARYAMITKCIILLPTSFEPDCVSLRNFKLLLFDLIHYS